MTNHGTIILSLAWVEAIVGLEVNQGRVSELSKSESGRWCSCCIFRLVFLLTGWKEALSRHPPLGNPAAGGGQVMLSSLAAF